MILDLIKTSRTIRRFDENYPIEQKTLLHLIEHARYSSSARNLQPLKYILSSDTPTNNTIFPTLTFAVALKDWTGPAEGERPTAYIIILGDTELSSDFGYDCGIACQNIMLAAREIGLGGCMMGSVNRLRLRQELQISDRFEILLVLALGKPNETIVIEPVPPDGNTQYWRDAEGKHHVPKRSLGDLLLEPEI